ncbi:MAG: carboxymuconolactone decarboxylase family protein [Planctomycetota bacterium]
MSELPPPPETFQRFVARYPDLGRAWELLGEAGRAGPLSPRERRLVKLGIAVGCLREGAVHSAARKALSADLSREELEQVVALAASTIGLPSAVAAWSWITETVERPTL